MNRRDKQKLCDIVERNGIGDVLQVLYSERYLVDNQRYAIKKIKVIGGVDDNMISVKTRCVYGNGNKDIAVINTNNIKESGGEEQ